MKINDYISQFDIQALIKKGGQKEVYKAIHPKFGFVVLKVGSTSRMERISREVNVLKTIESEFYPKLYDFVVEQNKFLIVEEFIDSTSLTNCMDRFFNPKDAILLIRRLTEGLNILWERRIVHRDIKPDNILILASGYPKIIDLGIARLLDETSLTATLAAKGPATPIYAAPEQLTNKKNIIDFRTDLFNLGILLAQLMLKGEHPFDPSIVGSGRDIVENIISGNWYMNFLDDNPFDRHVRSVLIRLLGKEPYQRYRYVSHLFRDIDLLLEDNYAV